MLLYTTLLYYLKQFYVLILIIIFILNRLHLLVTFTSNDSVNDTLSDENMIQCYNKTLIARATS